MLPRMGGGQEDSPEEGTCELSNVGVEGWGKGITGRADIVHSITYVFLATIVCQALFSVLGVQ